MVSIILFVLLLVVPVTTQATTYYVATTGTNSNDGLSEASPKRTVAHCVSLMVAGDTCLVMAGNYSEGLIRFGRTGTQTNPIRLAAYPGAAPKITFVDPEGENFDRILIQNTSGSKVAIGWITIEGLELTNGHDGIKWHNLHDSTIRRNWIHDNRYMGIMGVGGTRLLIERNIFNHNGRFEACETTTPAYCILHHGIYAHGTYYTITNNVIYDNLSYGITHNGSSSSTYSPSVHAGPEFATAANWVIAHNTFAYSRHRGGIVVWGAACTNARYENNIFYENNVTNRHNQAQGVEFSSGSGSTGIKIRNNHFYASGSGNTAQYSGTQPGDLVSTGNVVNVSPPAFVNGGSNALPASPDFRLTARAPVNMALATEFQNNGIVGAFQPFGDPTGTITTNKIRLTFPASTAVPIRNLSTTGVTAACTLSNCPGALTPTNVTNVPSTDTVVEIQVSGFVGDACPSTNLSVTASYNSASGAWTGNDNIGPYPGLHQKILSFTNLSLVNNCTGSGPTGYTAGYQLYIPFSEGSGTVANDASANNLDCTFTNGPTWGAGKNGSGMVTSGNNAEHCAVGYGSGIDLDVTDLTIAFGVNIPVGNEGLSRQYVGTPLGSGQRLYVSTLANTWRVGVGTSNDGTAGDIAVTSGWHYVCLKANSATNTVTLQIDSTVSASAGGVKTHAGYILAGDFHLGHIPGTTTGGGGGTYDDFLIYPSLQNCDTLYAAFSAAATPPAGTLKQEAIRFNGVVLDTSHNPIVLGSLVQSIAVPKRGGAVILFQVRCTNVADCDMTAFRLVYAKNGFSTWQQVPNVETADGTWMWGVSTEANMNNGIRSTRLTGSCTMTPGATLMTADQVPSIDLPQDGCTVLAYIVHVDGVAGVDYFDFKLRTQSDLDLPGGYDEIARIKVVNPMAGGVGY